MLVRDGFRGAGESDLDQQLCSPFSSHGSSAPTSNEQVGEFETPQSDCFPTSVPDRASDAFLRLMRPGDEVEAVEHVRADLVVVYVRNGQKRRTVLLQGFGGGDWGEAVDTP